MGRARKNNRHRRKRCTVRFLKERKKRERERERRRGGEWKEYVNHERNERSSHLTSVSFSTRQRRVRKGVRDTVKTFRNGTMKEAWDHSKTLQENYTRLGLVGRLDLNNAAPGQKLEDKERKTDDSTHIFAHVKPEASGVHRLRRRFHVSKGEADYLRPLIKKYGDDYTKMFRDIKMNYKQYTRNHLRRRCTRLLLDDNDVAEKAANAKNDSEEEAAIDEAE